MLDLNRRSLIKGSVAAGVTALFGTAAQASTKVPAKWDESHDVVVIGSGFAGLAAAIEAKKAGADTVVLEKMPTAGGNSIINHHQRRHFDGYRLPAAAQARHQGFS